MSGLNYDIILFIANIFTSIAIIPQIYKLWIKKDSDSHSMLWHYCSLIGFFGIDFVYFSIGMYFSASLMLFQMIMRTAILLQIYIYANKKIHNNRYYLAHNLNFRHSIRVVELFIENELGIELHNPFYDTERDDVDRIDKGEITRWDFDQKECEGIVERDLAMIDICKGILTIISEASIGTTLEIAYAKSKGKEIYVISKKFHKHPWLKVYATKTFEKVSDFVKWWKNGKK